MAEQDRHEGGVVVGHHEVEIAVVVQVPDRQRRGLQAQGEVASRSERPVTVPAQDRYGCGPESAHRHQVQLAVAVQIGGRHGHRPRSDVVRQERGGEERVGRSGPPEA